MHRVTKVIDGKQIAAALRAKLALEVQSLRAQYGRAPALGLVMVGNRPDSELYVKMKRNACRATGITSINYLYDVNVEQQAILDRIDELNRDPRIDGILVQLPLPDSINTAAIVDSIHPSKDVDGLHPFNFGELSMRHREPSHAPCTARGILALLDAIKVPIRGKTAVVIGRSELVGHPVNMMLRRRDATVIQCHSYTENLQSFVAQGDIVVAACGAPFLVRGGWLKPGCSVIDVGINFVPDANSAKGQKLVGDVCFDEVFGVADHITPVPGGVGPMTIAMLLRNVVDAFKIHEGCKDTATEHHDEEA